MAHENALLVEVMDEIESLHRHFVEWFTGEVPKVDAIFNDTIGNRFAKDIELIPPAGVTLSYSDLISGLYSFHDGNPGFRIAIRNVRIREVSGDLIVAAYEEWQRHALNSTPLTMAAQLQSFSAELRVVRELLNGYKSMKPGCQKT